MSRRIIAIMGVVLASSAQALDVKTYMALHSAQTAEIRSELDRFVQGIGAGFVMANARLEDRKVALLFCAPSKLTLNSDNYISLIDAAIAAFSKNKTKAQLDEMLVEALLLQKLEDTFPCTKK